MKKHLITAIIISLAFTAASLVKADNNLAQRLAGRILLQVESHGEAWYVNPENNQKYYLGRPSDAFNLMKNLSIGVTNENLSKIPVGLTAYAGEDDDRDGLINNLEEALGTDSNNADSDNDSYNDKAEVENNYNPLGVGRLNIDLNFTENYLGKIFLQVEKQGQAWYINPADKKRYFLARPTDAFSLMRNLSLGISNNNLNQIETGVLPQTQLTSKTTYPTCEICQSNNADQVFEAASLAIIAGNTAEAKSYFTSEMQTAVEYTMNFLDREGEFTLGNLMAGAQLSESTENKKIYSTKIYFSFTDDYTPVSFQLEREDGNWKLVNLGYLPE